MALEGVPWMVNLAEHSAEVGRLLAFAATGGGEGVASPGDFKVIASAIPDGNIHVAPGAAVALNRGEGGASQSYLIRNVSDTVAAMTPQPAGGPRYDLVCVIVEDPQYAGMPDPPDVQDGPYVRIEVYENVDAATRYLSEVDADQTGYAIARVKFDASDGTVTNADITDLRELVQPRRKEVVLAVNAAGTTNLTNADAVNPPEATSSQLVPAWATHVLLEAHWSGVRMDDTGAGTGNVVVAGRVVLGAIATQGVIARMDASGASQPVTTTYFAAEELAVAEGLRGTFQNLQAQQKYISKAGANLYTDQYSAVLLKATFIEKVS